MDFLDPPHSLAMHYYASRPMKNLTNGNDYEMFQKYSQHHTFYVTSLPALSVRRGKRRYRKTWVGPIVPILIIHVIQQSITIKI